MLKKLLILLVLWCVSMPALAQEETEQPSPTPTIDATSETPTATPTLGTPTPTFTPRPDVPAYIYDWREELLYPVAVYFFLVIDRPLNTIQDIKLMMTVQGEAEPRLLEFAQIQSFVTVDDPYTEFKLVWLIPPQNPLPLNARVNYEWQITLSETEITSVPGVFAYQHPQIEWVIDTDSQSWLDLLLPVVDGLSSDDIRRRYTPVYEQLSGNTGFSPRFQFALQNDEYKLDPCLEGESIISSSGDVEVACNPDVLNNMLARMGYTLLTDDTSFITRITPTLIDNFYAPLWLNHDSPPWFRQGITMLYTQVDKGFALDLVKSASRTNTLFSLDEMNSIPDERRDLWYAQSYIMTIYMANRMGLTTVFDLAKNPLSEPNAFELAYQTGMNASLEALMPTLNQWIFTDQAQSVASVSLYDEPTPIPSPTPSETAFPPTPTNTATNTSTATATATVTGVLSATPLPTFTPTISPTPRPPTITPRPAGFRDPVPAMPTLEPLPVDATPFPPIEGDIQATSDSGVLVTVILALALVALAILFAVYWRTERTK